MEPAHDSPIFCHRCAAHLQPGNGNFYLVRILAVADPHPPCFTEEDLELDIDAQVEDVIQELQDLTEQEATDQVFRRLTIHLCATCYADWIENPAG